MQIKFNFNNFIFYGVSQRRRQSSLAAVIGLSDFATFITLRALRWMETPLNSSMLKCRIAAVSLPVVLINAQVVSSFENLVGLPKIDRMVKQRQDRLNTAITMVNML